MNAPDEDKGGNSIAATDLGYETSTTSPRTDEAGSSVKELQLINDTITVENNNPADASVKPAIDTENLAVLEQGASHPEFTRAPLPCWYPKYRGNPVFYGNAEALGFACTVVGQAGILIGSGAFIGPAMVNLAKQEAGCETEAPSSADEIPECTGTVYGIKPSSLLTLMSSVIGLVSAFIIPMAGAIVDYTPHRRLCGRVISVLLSAAILSLAFLGEESWFALAFMLSFAFALAWGQAMLFHAYLPELTDNEQRLNEFSKAFTIVIFTSMVVYLAVVMGIGVAVGVAEDDVALARVGAIVAFVLSTVLFYVSWGLLFGRRPASHTLPQGQSLISAGFYQVIRTTIKIYKEYRALKWFYVAIVFGDAGIQSLSVIAITYITDQLQFSSQEVAAAALLMLIGSIPGAVVGALLNARINPIRSSAMAILGMILGTTFAASFLIGPGQQPITYCFAFMWGAGTGWKFTSDRVLSAGIIPVGQDAELMGFYMFCGQVFAWVPSLIFTVLNEAGVSQRIGLATLNGAFLVCFLAYCMMGSYSDAIAKVDRVRLDPCGDFQTPSTKKIQQS